MRSQSSGAFYKSLFDNANDGILLADLETQKFYLANRAICRMLGYSQEKIKNLRVKDIHPQKDLSYVLDQFKRQSKGRVGENILAKDMPMKRKNGSVFYTDISASRVKLAGKIYLMGIFRDITDRKQVDKNLEDAKIAARNVLEDLGVEKSKMEMAKAKEEAILLSIGDGLFATDEKGKIMLVNKPAEKMLGLKSEEVVGKIFFETLLIEDEKGIPVPLEKRPVSMALITDTTTTATISTIGPTYYYVRKDKTRFPVAIMVTPVILGGKVIGTIEVFRDITQEKKTDRAKTEFVSLASHQLRTPLTTISWYTEMILKGDVGKVVPGQIKYLNEIYLGNQRMIELVNTLLNVSRIELGTFAIEPKPTNIVTLAQSVLEEQKPKIENKKLMVAEDFGKDVPIFSIDPKLLRMIFQNLLANSVEYTPEGGKIKFTISLDKKKTVLIKVSDTGYGIPKNQQDKIFTKLFRADNVKSKDTDGTGLGLYIVKSIVENTGGKIWFKSEENKGTTFYVTFLLDGMKRKEGSTQLS
jgi:two-component system sensor histidine kinase VicK